jgi:hypothetical protein
VFALRAERIAEIAQLEFGEASLQAQILVRADGFLFVPLKLVTTDPILAVVCGGTSALSFECLL